MNIDQHALCARLGLATLNGWYQGLIVSALVAVALRLLLKSNAATRHAVWFVSLWLVALLIPAHYCLDRPVSGGRAPADPGPSVGSIQSLPDSSEADFSALYFDLERLDETAGPAPAATEAAAPSHWPPAFLGRAPLAALAPEKDAGGWETVVSTDWVARLLDAAKSASRRFLQPMRPILWRVESVSAFPLLSSLILLWLSISVTRLAALMVRLRQIGRFSREASPPSAELLARFGRLREEGRVRRLVELRISRQQRCPVVLGFFHPVVLLPADMAAGGDGAELDHVLRHELAHVRRYDDWANLTQHFIQALLFFHPAVWWINRRLSLEREIACDDHVLDQGGGRRHYALILTTVASRLSQETPMLAPGVSNSNNQLQQRIHMILNTRRNASPSLAKGWSTTIISATTLLAAIALYAGPRLVLAAAPAAAISSGTAAISVSSQTSADAVESDRPASTSVAVVTSIDAPVQVSADVGPGPKFKPEVPGSEVSVEDQLEPPEPPEASNDSAGPKPPAAPRVARAGKAARAPRAPESPDAMNKDDGSIEDRLRRLEKMMTELMDQQGLKRSHGALVFKDGADMKFNFSPEQMEKLKQSAERQAARAAEQAQRATEQAKRATKDLEARLEQEQTGKGEFHESLQRQLESLRKAREGLSQEMERLNHQINKLEREQERNNNKNSDKDPERRSEATTGELRAQVSPAPEIAW